MVKELLGSPLGICLMVSHDGVKGHRANRVEEERKAVSGTISTSPRGQHDAVRGGPQDPSGQILQHVPDVDGQISSMGFNGNPIAISVEHLKAIG
jgi:hypothetical protein